MHQNNEDSPHEYLKALFNSAVERVSPYRMIREQISLSKDGELRIKNYANILVDVYAYRKIIVIGAGKASAPMAQALEAVFGEAELKLPVEGFVSVKYGHTAPTKRIRIHEAGHPIPDAQSIYAGERVAEIAEAAGADCLIICLISGGGSALLSRAYPGLEHSHIQALNTLLLESGASIHEMNTIRKHCSGIKGGRLAELAYPAQLLNIILSDVTGDNLEVIASGPTVADPTSFTDVWKILRKYSLKDRIPQAIAKHFHRGLEESAETAANALETPKPGAEIFKTVQTVLLGNNRSALRAAAHYAEKLGYEVLVLTSALTGEAREVARVFAAIALDPPRDKLCILAGGETTVTIRGNGKGGRNQELALAYLNAILEARPEPSPIPRAYFLAAGSDGNDGPTDAAGGIICPADIAHIRQSIAAGSDSPKPDEEQNSALPNSPNFPDPAPYLANNNAYEYLDQQRMLFKTGPTNTNVCDFCFLLIDSA